MFFGHRDAIKSKVEVPTTIAVRRLILEGVTTFYFGGMGNFDHIAAGIVKNCKGEFPHIKMVLSLPYHTLSFKKNREYLQNYYDSIVFPLPKNVCPKAAISQRNSWLVEQSTHVICYLRRKSGGAYKAVEEAQAKAKIVIRV